MSITSEQIRAARALLRWEQRDLAQASGVSLPSVKRLETRPGDLAAQERTIVQLRKALEKAGVEFIAENGGGAGVRPALHRRRPLRDGDLRRQTPRRAPRRALRVAPHIPGCSEPGVNATERVAQPSPACRTTLGKRVRTPESKRRCQRLRSGCPFSLIIEEERF